MNKRRTLKLIFLAITLLSGVLVSYYALSIAWESYNCDVHVTRIPNLESTDSYGKNKTILLWNSFFGDDWFYFGKTGHFDRCPKYKNCMMTNSKELINVWKFDAVLFHGNELKWNDIPKHRSSRQQYVFVNLESPRNRPLPYSSFENYFNMTMTYRLDSDIHWPYYVVSSIDTKEVVAPHRNVKWIEPSYDPLRWNLDLRFDGKTKMAAWLVSHCKTDGRREIFVKELEKEIQVDRIGKCVRTVIPNCVASSADCFAKVIEPHYFFYLAFENTLCQDYVTEKFFNALSHDIIPVVYGGANYSIFAPPHSYIDALDFDSPKALANFLMELSQDREEYLKYFWWKRFYTVGSSRDWTLCNLCESLNKPKPPRTYSPLTDWFEKDKCPIQDLMHGNQYATKELRIRTVNQKNFIFHSFQIVHEHVIKRFSQFKHSFFHCRIL